MLSTTISGVIPLSLFGLFICLRRLPVIFRMISDMGFLHFRHIGLRTLAEFCDDLTHGILNPGWLKLAGRDRQAPYIFNHFFAACRSSGFS